MVYRSKERRSLVTEGTPCDGRLQERVKRWAQRLGVPSDTDPLASVAPRPRLLFQYRAASLLSNIFIVSQRDTALFHLAAGPPLDLKKAA